MVKVVRQHPGNGEIYFPELIMSTLIFIVWIIGILISYKNIISTWETKKKYSKYILSVIWPISLLLYNQPWFIDKF